MATTQPKITVQGAEKREGLYEKRTKRFFLIFKTEWWELVSSTSLGNEIHIMTERPISNVYINGEKVC